ncbi:RHS repeat-associated core domain-containing protein [Dactylosporangium darangshiense]|uniref:RHS repeat-associated core domain-containing protein n=1 Tax=Dactylosporangium darangshiense TaxID=579108 RepID=UPI003642958E
MTTGNRTKDTKHVTSGDTVRDYTYPSSGPTSVRPHTVTGIASTGAVTSTDSYTYDNAGNTQTRTITAGPNQTLTWDKEGHLSTVADSTGTTTYTYDTGGAWLVAADPQGTTVYLAGFDLRQQNGTTTTTRFYGSVAVRTTGGLTWLAADYHGTGALTIDAVALTTTRRRLDPFGNPRTATSVAWPANRGFVGGILDNTGLTHLGAREYEPTTGRFISDDPITDPSDPQQINGYSYARQQPHHRQRPHRPAHLQRP